MEDQDQDQGSKGTLGGDLISTEDVSKVQPQREEKRQVREEPNNGSQDHSKKEEGKVTQDSEVELIEEGVEPTVPEVSKEDHHQLNSEQEVEQPTEQLNFKHWVEEQLVEQVNGEQVDEHTIEEKTEEQDTDPDEQDNKENVLSEEITKEVVDKQIREVQVEKEVTKKEVDEKISQEQVDEQIIEDQVDEQVSEEQLDIEDRNEIEEQFSEEQVDIENCKEAFEEQFNGKQANIEDCKETVEEEVSREQVDREDCKEAAEQQVTDELVDKQVSEEKVAINLPEEQVNHSSEIVELAHQEQSYSKKEKELFNHKNKREEQSEHTKARKQASQEKSLQNNNHNNKGQTLQNQVTSEEVDFKQEVQKNNHAGYTKESIRNLKSKWDSFGKEQSSPQPNHIQRSVGKESSPPDMADTTKTSRFGGTVEKCAQCNRTVYAMEKMEVSGRLMHKTCFRCCKCNSPLSVGRFSVGGGDLYCMTHYKQAFREKGTYDVFTPDNPVKGKWQPKPPE